MDIEIAELDIKMVMARTPIGISFGCASWAAFGQIPVE